MAKLNLFLIAHTNRKKLHQLCSQTFDIWLDFEFDESLVLDNRFCSPILSIINVFFTKNSMAKAYRAINTKNTRRRIPEKVKTKSILTPSFPTNSFSPLEILKAANPIPISATIIKIKKMTESISFYSIVLITSS